MTHAVLDQVWRDAAIALRPAPAPQPYVAFAPSIILPDGRGKERPYDPATHPAQLTILQALDGGTYFAPRPFTEVAAAKPVQDGGSLVTLVPLLRRIVQQRQAVLLAFPSLDSAKDQWTTKVLPVLEGLGGHMPKSGGGSRGGAARVVTFPSGGRFLLRAAGGRGESQQAAVTGDALCIEEVDDWPSQHRLELIQKRIIESPDPLLLLVSTVKRATESLILAAVEEGTDSRLHFACPDCGHHQTLEMENVRYEKATPSQAADKAIPPLLITGSERYVCTACASALPESGRLAMLSRYLVVHRGQQIEGRGREARVTGPIPDTPRFGIRWSRLESPRTALSVMCRMHMRAAWYLERYQHDPMKSFYQDQLTRPYTGEAEVGRADLVESALVKVATASTYARGQLPADCDIVTIGADIQLRRHYWVGVGFNAAENWFIGDWGRDAIAGDMEQPTLDQRIAGLERLDGLSRGGWRAGTDGQILSPFGAIDTGFRPDELRPWIARNRTRWIAAKGAGGELVSRMVRAPLGKRIDYEEGWYDVREQEESPDRLQLFVDADAVLDRIAADWANGRGHLPRDVDPELLRHLTGMKPGTGKVRWEVRGARHDFLDALIYALAVARYLRALLKRSATAAGGETSVPRAGWVDDFAGDGGEPWVS